MNKSKIMNSLSVDKDKKWYKIEAKANVADVFIYDEISWFGISADDFVKDLNAVDASLIKVHLNTPGGNVFDGVAIHNALKQHKAKVETYIEGLAASIGSIIALAGETVYMAKNAFFMIHEPWIIAVGDSTDLRKTADVLDKIRGTLVQTYVDKTGKDEKQVDEWVKAETWFTAEEAKDAGFIDEIIDEEKEPENKYDLGIYDNAPDILMCQKKQKPHLTMMELALELQKRS